MTAIASKGCLLTIVPVSSRSDVLTAVAQCSSRRNPNVAVSFCALPNQKAWLQGIASCGLTLSAAQTSRAPPTPATPTPCASFSTTTVPRTLATATPAPPAKDHAQPGASSCWFSVVPWSIAPNGVDVLMGECRDVDAMNTHLGCVLVKIILNGFVFVDLLVEACIHSSTTKHDPQHCMNIGNATYRGHVAVERSEILTTPCRYMHTRQVLRRIQLIGTREVLTESLIPPGHISVLRQFYLDISLCNDV